MNLRFKLNAEEIKKWPEEDYEAIEMAQDGEVKFYRLRPIMARYLVDEAGKPLPKAIALKQLGKIPIDEWAEVVRQFAAGITSVAVPNASRSLSELPSEVNSQAPSPDGSQL